MVASIGYSLGIGSGIDTKALIDSLAAAVRGPKEAQIVKREEANAAKVSALGEASSAIDSFASALSSLIAGGTLFSQPSVSDASVLSASAQAGARIGGLAAQIEVRQLAQAQTLVSQPLAGSSAAVGEGTLTLQTAAGSFAININAGNNSLEGLVQAINGANAGVTASILTESGNARLMLKGATGEAQAFSLSVPAGTTSGLERFRYDPVAAGGMTAAQQAQDAIVRLDGIEVKRAANSFSDLIPGVQIDLKRAVPGSIVSLGVTRPKAAIEQAMDDFVAAYNELAGILAEATAAPSAGTEAGPLRGDLSIRELQRQLSRLPSTILSSEAGPQTLAEIGVATNRDGTLSLNRGQLQAALEANPDVVEALFNPSQRSSNPLIVVMNKMGKVKPGTYTVTDLVPAGGGVDASGKVDGMSFLPSGPHLIAPAGSAALGMILDVRGAVASATIIVDAGLGGALQAIRDSLKARSGAFASAQERLNAEAKSIAKDRETLEARSTAYYDRLVTQFTAMERQVSAFKATQSYLDQQIKIWTGDND